MVNLMRDIMNTDWGVIASFITLLAGIYTMMFQLRNGIVRIHLLLDSKITLDAIKGYSLILSYIVIGVVLPVIIIIGLWSAEFSWSVLLLRILAGYLLFSFFGLIWITYSMLSMVKKIEAESAKSNPVKE